MILNGDVVTLSGEVLADEVQRLLIAIARVPGVGRVEDVLVLHDDPENFASKPQDNPGRKRQESNQPRPHEWSPGARIAAAFNGLAEA